MNEKIIDAEIVKEKGAINYVSLFSGISLGICLFITGIITPIPPLKRLFVILGIILIVGFSITSFRK